MFLLITFFRVPFELGPDPTAVVIIRAFLFVFIILKY